jgi:hypothetical protein
MSTRNNAPWHFLPKGTAASGLLIDYIRGVTPVEAGSAMTFPVIVHPLHGQIEATLVGAPDVRATAATREEALAALEAAIAQRLEQGDLVALEIRGRGLPGLFGKYRDDPTLREICEAAYQERDADVRE